MTIAELVAAGVPLVRIAPWEQWSFLELDIDIAEGAYGPWAKLHAGYFPYNEEPRPFLAFAINNDGWEPWVYPLPADTALDAGGFCCPGHAQIAPTQPPEGKP